MPVATNDQGWSGALSPAARTLPESGIVRVFNYGHGRPGLVPMWAGEGDQPTPPFIAEAAARSLAAGETFYTNNRGISPLREALARFTSRLYDLSVPMDEFIVTGGGMQAIQLAMQATISPGDEVVIPSPAWPNFEGAIRIQGGLPVYVPMTITAAGWTLPLDKLFAAVTERTRAIVINSPSNPTGWTASREELSAILDFARARNLWIVADEIYARFVYEGDVAPSFQSLRRRGDRIIFVNTFSKNWAMTGWRIGWLQVPAELAATFESLVQYNTSGVATFMQRAAIAAITEGEAFAREQIERARRGREIVGRALAGLNRVTYAPPAGAFYAFFSVSGLGSATDVALRLVDEANIGIAPGTAFGPGGETCFRVCFLRSEAPLTEAMRRFKVWLAAQDG